MADPYGYTETAPSTSGQASQAMYAGVFALICAATAPCFCYLPYVMSLPLGGYALYAGSQVRRGDDALATAESSMATGGMIAGGVAVLLSLVVLLVVLAYVGLVVVMVLAGA